MKVLLANGEKFQITKYEPVSVQIDGDKTKGVQLYFEDIAEDKIRGLLSDMSNFATLGLYTDRNVFVNELTGYQVKVGVGLGDEPNSYVLTIAQGTETSAKVEILRKEVDTAVKTVEEALSAFEACTKAINEITPQFTEIREKSTVTNATVEEHTNTLAELGKTVKTAMSTVSTALDKVAVINDNYEKIQVYLADVVSMDTELRQYASEAVNRINEVYKSADQLSSTYLAKIAEISQVVELANKANEQVAANDNSIQLAVEKVNTVDTTIDDFKTKMEEQEELVNAHGKTVAFPDQIEQPSRTMLTSESQVGRTSHVIRDFSTDQLRILTPVECERLNGFPDGWTDTGMPERMRYFVMGNALVVPLITKLGAKLSQDF